MKWAFVLCIGNLDSFLLPIIGIWSHDWLYGGFIRRGRSRLFFINFKEDIFIQHSRLWVVVLPLKLLGLVEVWIDHSTHLRPIPISSALIQLMMLALYILWGSRPLSLKKLRLFDFFWLGLNFSSFLSLKGLFTLELSKVITLISLVKQHVLESVAQIRCWIVSFWHKLKFFLVESSRRGVVIPKEKGAFPLDVFHSGEQLGNEEPNIRVLALSL